MSVLSPESAALFARAVVVGIIGGVGLVMGYRYSTRGAIIFPIYAAILLAATLVISQFPDVGYSVRFSGVLLAMLVSTAIAMAEVLNNAARQRRLRAERGLPPVEGRAPWWAAPVVFASVAAASASVAVLIR